MDKRQKEACKHFLAAYKFQWDLNQQARANYDDDLEYYTGYRDETNYPLAYNMTFPQLLPRIMTMLSRMLEQIYQGGASDLVGVRPRKKSDVDRAPRVQGLLNYQLETLNDIDCAGSSYLFNYQWMVNALSWGSGIAKVYWKKEERISPKRIQFPIPQYDQYGRLAGMMWKSITQQAPQIVYDAPYAEVLHNKLFVPHPHYKLIQKMPFVFCVYKRSVDYLREMQQKGIYRNIKELGWDKPSTAVGTGYRYPDDSMEAFAKSLDIENYVQIAELQTDRMAPSVDVIEGYGKYIFPEDETAYDIGSGIKVKGKESEAIVHIGNYKVLLSIQKNTYGYKPFFNIGAYRHPELFWDMGIIRLGKAIQEQYDTLANTRYQGALMLVNPMLLIEQDSDIPIESLIWKPFGFVPGGVEQGVDQVKSLTIPDTFANTFREQEEFFKSTIEDMTGMYRYNMGATPTRQEAVGTIHCLKSDSYEILTSNGWKMFHELERTEEVMTLNYDTGEMEYQMPSEYIEYPEDEYELYHFNNASAEFYCTGEHRLPIEREGRSGFNKQIVRARELSEYSHAKIPLTGEWKGTGKTENPFGISGEDWCAFMGLWLSEGHVQHTIRNHCYAVGITQCSQENIDRIEELLKRLPFNFSKNGDQWIVNNKKLWEYLVTFGYSYEKYIPYDILILEPKLLEIFFDWYHFGDGHYNAGGQRCITTSSKQMADDLQEILLKIGKRSNIWTEKAKEPHHHDKYHLAESSDKYTWWYHNGIKSVVKEKYKCKVSCLTVPNGIFMIRSVKYKKPVWTGNSLQAMGEARIKLLLMTMDYQGFQPLLKYMMLLNTWHLPDNFEARINGPQGMSFSPMFAGDIHPDYDFTARYTSMEPSLGKHFRAQTLLQYYQIWSQSPYLQQYEFMKSIMEMMDFYDTDKYLKTPQQVSQEQQQMMQQQIQMKALELQGKDHLAASQSKRNLERDVVKQLMK